MPRMNTPHPPVEEVIHGVTVKDPYRWLEDRSLPETEEWLQDQKRRCDEYFAQCPDLDRIRERVREYLDVEVMDQPARIGETLFFRRRAKGQEQGCIYVRQNGVDRLLVDPSPEGIFVSVGIHRISRDGQLLAYERKEGGEDTKSIHIVDVETGQRFSAHLERGFARGFVFTPDNRGFYYCHETTNATGDHEIRLRRFDESVEDQVVFRAARSRGSRLVLTADDVNIGAIFIRDGVIRPILDFWIVSQSYQGDWNPIVRGKSLPFSPVLKHGKIFAAIQDPYGKKRLVELDQCGAEIRTVIPTDAGNMRDLVISDRVYATFYVDGHFLLRCWTLDGSELSNIPIAPQNTVRLVHDLGDGRTLFFISESFAEPPAIYEFFPDGQEISRMYRPLIEVTSVPLEVREERCAANDGVTVPVTLVSFRSNEVQSSLLMTSYGGFGVPSTPQFSVLVALLLKMGATFALVHVRGGSEGGSTWQRSARGRTKRRSVEDFIAAAQWLCERETTPPRLAIFGASNGGWLVSAAMTDRPDLFCAVLSIAPLLDMLRYETFDDASRWRSEYGSVSDPNDFSSLHSISPYHQVKTTVDYPATLIVSGGRDSRCNPAHARKMIAILQNRRGQQQKILLDHTEMRGHSPSLPLSVRIKALSQRIAFLSRELGLQESSEASYDRLCN